jgi:lipooligosaccharide transport system permease protein
MAWIPKLSTRSFRVWRRNAIVWRHGAMWSSLLGDLFEPILYLYGLGYGLGYFVEDVHGMDYATFIAPGLMAMGAMWSASFENTYAALTRMLKQKTYEAVMVTPINIEEVVGGDILWAATKAGIGAVMMLLVVSWMGLASWPTAIWSIPHAFLAGLTFGAISMAVTAVAPNYDFFMYYFTIGLTPMLLFSGAWYPLDGLPVQLRILSELLPLTHAVRPIRAFLTGTSAEIWPSVGVLLAYTVIFSFVAMTLVRRRLVR